MMNRRRFLQASASSALAAGLTRPFLPLGAAEDSDAPQVWGFQVVNAFPHDPDAYTQGLVFIPDGFFEGTGLYGQSGLRETVLKTGEVLREEPLSDEYFGEGIALVDDRIYQITWQEETAFLYDRESFERIGEFEYEGEGWGLTWNGEHLVMSNGSNVIAYRDPETFEIVSEIDVMSGDEPIDYLNELEWIDDEIWANVYQTDWIVRIDPESGQVNSWVDLRGLLPVAPGERYPGVLNGIAWDAEGERLFVTGKLWPTLFEIELIAFS